MSLLLSLKGVSKLDRLCMLFMIMNSSDEKKFVNLVNKYNIGFKVIMHAHGTASSSLLEYFGLNNEDKKVMTMVLPITICRQILKEIEQKINVNQHGRGIFFSISLSSGTKYMLDFYQNHEMEDVDMEEVNQHLIVTIVNEGYAEKVMSEAKKAGATGGTTLNGRGLNSEEAVKFLNISIEPEKDIVLILVDTEIKNDIMNAILTNCGLKTPGAGICFSLPVDYVVGISHMEKK